MMQFSPLEEKLREDEMPRVHGEDESTGFLESLPRVDF